MDNSSKCRFEMLGNSQKSQVMPTKQLNSIINADGPLICIYVIDSTLKPYTE